MNLHIPDGMTHYEFIKKVNSHPAQVDRAYLFRSFDVEGRQKLIDEVANLHLEFPASLSAAEVQDYEKLPMPVKLALTLQHYNLLTEEGKTLTALYIQGFPAEKTSSPIKHQNRAVAEVGVRQSSTAPDQPGR